MKLANINLFGRDIAALCAFYEHLFGFRELLERRSEIYRCLDAGGTELGFNAWQAYPLLHLDARQPQPGPAAVTAYPTFACAEQAEVDAHVERCVRLGGSVVKPAAETRYRAYQAVLADPEDHVFRVQCPARPAPEIMT